MGKDYSPFIPGQPVPPEFFAGRRAELEDMARKASEASKGRLGTIFLSGERGIGKSSLAAYARAYAEREHRALGLHVFLGGVATLEEMVRRVIDRVLKESTDHGWLDKIRDLFGKHVSQVGLFGVSVEFRAGTEDLRSIVNDFSSTLNGVARGLDADGKPIFLVLDDINGLAETAAFAHWLKSFVDGIATGRSGLSLCLVLVGLEERRQTLIRLQPSLARVFDLIEIPPWKPEEARTFFASTFNSVGVGIEPDVADFLAYGAGGLPVLAHEIGDAVFKIDRDNRVDMEDAKRGVGIAAEIVGRKHLEPRVMSAIRSTRYRSILRKLAKQEFSMSFKRSDMRDLLTSEEKGVMDNFLTKMKKLGVVIPDLDGGPGAYRFSNQLHRLYLHLESWRAKEER